MPSRDGYDAARDADPHADDAGRRALRGPDGHVLLAYTTFERVADGTPWADHTWLPLGVSAGAAAERALEALPGWLLSTDDAAYAAALVTRGAVEHRYAHTMTHDLDEARLPSTARSGTGSAVSLHPLSAAQVRRHAARLADVHRRAYPAGHPDAIDGGTEATVRYLRAIADADVLGPLNPASCLAVSEGCPLGACLVVDRPGAPPHAGPWVVDVFRDPGSPLSGVGAALLCHSLRAAAAAGLTALSLIVTDGNEPARRLYRWTGFVDVAQSWTLALPQRALPQRALPERALP